MKLSIVTTLFHSTPYIAEFHKRIKACADAITDEWELILVDDGSQDDSLATALAVQEQDPRVVVVELSRNFGHHRAAMTGLRLARGEMVYLTDVDLEEEPELLTRFYEQYRATGPDVVYGVMAKRKGGLFERLSGRVFYMLHNLLSDQSVPPDLLMSRLMSRPYVDALTAHGERCLDIAGLWSAAGFEQCPVTVEKLHKGSTQYTFWRKLSLMHRAITSFSNKPLHLIGVLGFVILLLATLSGAYFLLAALFGGAPPSGYLSLILSIWFLGGLMLMSLGIIASYLAVMFKETKMRPYSIIKNEYRKGKDAGHKILT